VGTADLFISEGTILKTQGRHRDANQHYIASPIDNEIPTPLIILINETTASAAEVLAAAIGEHDKGLIIGIPTYGKGSVQLVRYLPNEGQFNLTWKELFSPYGFSLSEFGVLPKICTKNIQVNTQDNLKILNKSVISKRHEHQERFINQSRKQKEKDINPHLECKKSPKKDNPNGDDVLQLAVDILTSQTLYKKLINHSTMIKF
jgi:carboxyl-terminal processing protease